MGCSFRRGRKFHCIPMGEMPSPTTQRRWQVLTKLKVGPLGPKVPLPESGWHAITVGVSMVEVKVSGGLVKLTVLVVSWTGSLLSATGRISPSYCQLMT